MSDRGHPSPSAHPAPEIGSHTARPPPLAGNPPLTITRAEVDAMGPGLASLLNMEQLQEAARLYQSITTATSGQNSISLLLLRQTFMNHLRSCLRMPRGGAGAGGSQQSGFEMELVSMSGARELMASWPNHESSQGGRRQSWELRTMQELAEGLALQERPAAWGKLMGKPIPLMPGHENHKGVLLAGPPFTVSWVERLDGTTSLCVRFPIVVWTEQDAVILPPDSEDGNPFYVDPPNQPGLHRDMFKTWGRVVAGELATDGYPMSAACRSHLPAQYGSDSEGHLSDGSGRS